jgi:hypothetical protein
MILYDAVRFYIILYDYVWLCMILWGSVWFCVVMYDSVWRCVVLYNSVWLCMIVYDSVWFCLMLCGSVRLCIILYDYVWYCLILYGFVFCVWFSELTTIIFLILIFNVMFELFSARCEQNWVSFEYVPISTVQTRYNQWLRVRPDRAAWHTAWPASPGHHSVGPFISSSITNQLQLCYTVPFLLLGNKEIATHRLPSNCLQAATVRASNRPEVPLLAAELQIFVNRWKWVRSSRQPARGCSKNHPR